MFEVAPVVDPERVVDEAGDDALLEQLAGQHVPEVLAGPLVVVLVDVVDALERVGDPADTAFGEREAEILVLAQDGGPQRSAAAWTMLIGCRLIMTSIGASIEVIRSWDDDPRCMQMTVPSSAQACHNGSQWLLCREGQPSFSGFSEKVTA